MRRTLSLLFGSIALFAVVAQYYLMIENRIVSVGESTIRFFGFFTILTNTMVAVYFLLVAFQSKMKLVLRPGTLTAITTYITIVGLVYQLVLRHLWNPEGLQMIVDELLHTVIPILVIMAWYLYEDKRTVAYSVIVKWLIYPLAYLVYILLRGRVSGFYPYPFVNVTTLGLGKVLLNSLSLLVLFVMVSLLYIKAGKSIDRRRR